MKRMMIFSSALILFSCMLGCEPRQSATLCLFSAADDPGADPSTFDCEVDPTSVETAPAIAAAPTLVSCPTAGIDEGRAYFLRHDLPDGLVSVGELAIHMETPCDGAERDLEATHVDGQVLLSFTPPRGASCAFLVTTTMAQSKLACDVLRPAPEPNAYDPCADLEALCADPDAR